MPCRNDAPLKETDRDEVRKLALYADKSVPLLHVFDQNFKFHNYGITFIGLFHMDNLIGCAMPGLDKIRNIVLSDVGSIVLSEYKNREALQLLWPASIQYAIENNAKPINFADTPESNFINTAETEKMGYTLISTKIVYSNIQS